MKNSQSKKVQRDLVFLSKEDLEILIYMTSDIWITPKIKRFKQEILDKLELDDSTE